MICGDVPIVIKKNEIHSFNAVISGRTNVTSLLPMLFSTLAHVSLLFDPNGESAAASPAFHQFPNESLPEAPLFSWRMLNPNWIRVIPSPAREPRRAACDVCSMYVNIKPMNWNETETSIFQRKEKTEPVARLSTITSPKAFGDRDVCTVVSQYGGTVRLSDPKCSNRVLMNTPESAWAAA